MVTQRHMPRADVTDRIRLGGMMLLAAALVWISADLSRYLSIPGATDTSAVWPPLGIALAAAWVFGRAWMPVYPLVIGAWFAAHGYSMVICALFMIEQGVELLLMTELHRRYVRESDFLSSLSGALRFYGYVVVIALLPAAALVALCYHQLGYFPAQPVVGVWLFQWLPEALGVVLFAPPMQRLFDALTTRTRPPIGRRALVLAFVFALILVASLTLAAFDRYNYARGLDYLFFPVLIVMALAGHVRTALLALPVAVVCTLLGVYLGTWATSSQAWNALGEALTYVGALAILTQIVMATTIERTGLIDSLRKASRHDMLTGEFNRIGLVEYIRVTGLATARHHVCLTLCLRDFTWSRELLPAALVDACERWILDSLRKRLTPVVSWIALARLDKGIYTVVAACQEMSTLDARVRDSAAAIKGEIFAEQGWEYQVDIAVAALPFDAADEIDDVITASRYKASDLTRSTTQTVYFDTLYRAQLADERAQLKALERIKHALRNDCFTMFGQQIVPLDPRACGRRMECLIRMVDADSNWVPPDLFLPVANRFGYMANLDRWVIRRVFSQVAALPALAERYDHFSINLSGASLGQPAIASYIHGELARSGLSARQFCFEVTETEAINDWSIAHAVLSDLKSKGFTISLDDFGTGLASFDYLNRFDFDYVKIDGSFVRTLDKGTINRDVIEAIVLVARRRGIQTVAEFVENNVVAEQLRRLDVDFVQGFGLHRPEPLSDICAASAPQGRPQNAILPAAARHVVMRRSFRA